jgi:hypothetical protein
VGVQQPLAYTITFENDPQKATAPAQEVIVTQQLDADLDWNTFELRDVGFGSLTVSVPPGVQSYQTRVDYQNQDASPLMVDISATFNQATGALSWSFRSVDPLTGGLPEGVFDGFLPVNDNTHRGEGFVGYVVRPKASLTTGTRIDAQAHIVFDTNPAIDTPQIFNTIDAGRPHTAVQPLPVGLFGQDTNIQLNWQGQDDLGGSGVASYDIVFSLDDGPQQILVSALTSTSYAMVAERGHKYAFRVVAQDNVAQRESKSAFDTTTVLLGPPWHNFTQPLDTNKDGHIVPLDVLLVINEL